MPNPVRTMDKEAREAWKVAPIPLLVHHIVDVYHLETRVEMARLESFAEAVVLQDGQDDPLLLEIREQVARLGTDMRAHMTFEERETFPAILGSVPAAQGAGGPGESMKRQLTDEHEAEAARVRRIRALTESYQPVEATRAAHGLLQTALKGLSESLQQHQFLENQILFQRTL